MYCKYCGKEIGDSRFCTYCGKPQYDTAAQPNYCGGRSYPPPPGYVQDAPNAGFAVLSFFFPLVGLVLYLVWRDTLPLRAHSCGKGALISVIVSAALSILLIIFYVLLFVLIFSLGPSPTAALSVLGII